MKKEGVKGVVRHFGKRANLFSDQELDEKTDVFKVYMKLAPAAV